jgi:hypothetical protein
MNERSILTVTSVLSVLLFSLHLAGDIILGFEPGNLDNLGAFPIFVVWLYAALALTGRRSGLVILMLASILASAVPILHMTGKGLGSARILKSDVTLFFIWTTLAIGVTAPISFILAARELWRSRRTEAK